MKGLCIQPISLNWIALLNVQGVIAFTKLSPIQRAGLFNKKSQQECTITVKYSRCNKEFG